MEKLYINDLALETETEKEDLTNALLCHAEFGKDIDLSVYLSAAYLIQKLCRSYKQMKELYFRDCTAEAQLMLEEKTELLRKENAESRAEIESLQQKNRMLQAELEKERRKTEQLQAELNRIRLENTELSDGKAELDALREFAYRSTQEGKEEIKKADYTALRSEKLLVLGGTPDWHQRMKKYLPKATFVGPEVTLNPDLIAAHDTVVIYTSYISHKMYYVAAGKAKHIIYVNNSNVKFALKQILDGIKVV